MSRRSRPPRLRAATLRPGRLARRAGRPGVGRRRLGPAQCLALARKNPGCLWLSLQYANLLMLVDSATRAVRKVMKVPSLLRRADGGAGSVGSPHCVRECSTTGRIWVELKGSVPCHPGEDLVSADTLAAAGGGRRGGLRAAIDRVCCNPRVLRQRMGAPKTSTTTTTSVGRSCAGGGGLRLWHLGGTAGTRVHREAVAGCRAHVQPMAVRARRWWWRAPR